MLKKLLTAGAAAAFALTLAAPIASACPGMDKAKVAEKEKPSESRKDVKKDVKKENKENDKVAQNKVKK